MFDDKGIKVLPFRSSNCAFKINWSEKFIEKNQGTPLKNIRISINNKVQKGEAVITKFGIEGNAVYGLSNEIQRILALEKEAVVYVDFKSAYDLARLEEILSSSRTNTSKTLREALKIPRVVVELLKEALTKEEFLDIPILAKFIKSFPLRIVASAPIDEAISTTGGVSTDAVDSNFEIRNLKNHFCIGEMIDWDAPTGGYLIQACASTGVYLANYLNIK